jgi:hypothetical protein
LIHKLDFYSTAYPPASWDWNLQDKHVWLAYAQFRYISKLNVSSKIEEIFNNPTFVRPIDIKWDTVHQRAVVLDQISEKIYMFKSNAILDSITIADKSIFKICLTDQSDVVAIEAFNVNLYLLEDDSTINIPISSGYSGKDMLYRDGKIYILTASDEANLSQIIIYNCSNGNQEKIDIGGDFTLLRNSPDNDYFWLCENIDGNNSHCVKLSRDGQRLLELSLSNWVDEIQINPTDHSIIMVHRLRDKFILFDSEGNKISENKQVFDPTRVSIQQ